MARLDLRRVLVAVDLGEASTPALTEATRLVERSGGKLLVLHVLRRQDGASSRGPLRAKVDEALRARLIQGGVDPATVEIELFEGDDVAAAVVQEAERDGVSAIALGAPLDHVSKVVARVVTHAHVPVLVARTHAPTGRVLAATDFSEPSRPAIDAAAEIARARGAELTLLHAVASPAAVDPAEARLSEIAAAIAPRPSTRVLVGAPDASIVSAARALDAELVVVGSRGRTGFSRLLLGSVAASIVRDAPCSVLVARG